jgi:hypothetical protein
MRVYCCVVIVIFFAALAVAQFSPTPEADAPTDLTQHHRQEDDEEALPSAASVSPDSAVITIEGVCDNPSDSGTPNDVTKAQENAAASKTGSAASASSACKTIVTKAQFEKLVDALNPQMTGMVRRQLAASYPRLLLFAEKARELGLQQDPSFAERMQFGSIQVLAQSLNRYFEQQANSISDTDVQKYYKENPFQFERAELMRILVPRQAREATKPASRGQTEGTMLELAQKVRARALAGEDFQPLQKEAFEAARIYSASPNVSMGKIAVTRLPMTQQKVFEMQPGQVSEVIIDPNGYYIYKMVSKDLVPLSQASKEIRKSIASQRVQDSVNSLTNSLKFDLNPMYFGTGRTGQADEDPDD